MAEIRAVAEVEPRISEARKAPRMANSPPPNRKASDRLENALGMLLSAFAFLRSLGRDAQAELELERRRKSLEPQVAHVHERQRTEQREIEGLRDEALRVAAEDLDQAELELEERTGEPWLPYPRGKLPEGPHGS